MLILASISLAQLALVAFLLWDRRIERREHTAQIERLCQRIQAPQSAAIMYEQERLPPSPPVLLPDDDDAFHEARKMTRDDLVAAMERNGQ